MELDSSDSRQVTIGVTSSGHFFIGELNREKDRLENVFRLVPTPKMNESGDLVGFSVNFDIVLAPFSKSMATVERASYKFISMEVASEISGIPNAYYKLRGERLQQAQDSNIIQMH